ncbi:MAG: DUF1549 domain-containing protein [Verrucomicrobia bacterium]|nr:DUF1549 domain-containing protein [Verrucomicrobiota bacterium]
MKPDVLKLVLAILLSVPRMAGAKISPEQAAQLPPPASHTVNFQSEIKPILEASCVKCHGRGKAKGGFQLDTRETFLKPADSGPVAVVGKSAESYLIELVAGLDPDNVMPKKGSKLTPTQIGLLRAWIDQGLKWDDAITFAKPAPVNLKPRRPELPPGTKGVSHPVDRFLQSYFAAHNFSPAAAVDDRTFARRVYLDVIGLLPPPDELKKFASDRRADKRDRLVKRLLGDNQRYAQHWLTFWNDALRNDYAGTGYIDGGRKQITGWLYSALATNMPYDRFVAELINPTRESEGFSKGIVWRGVVNASQTPPLQAAQNISQIFMGVNLKCASCHDSFINDWALADAYGLANIYADEPLEMFQCDKPTGKKAPTRFIYSELGTIAADLPKTNRLQRLAEIVCNRQDGRLARTIVNRLWARFMGRGLIEPVDDMEQPAWQPDLLDWLAEDLADHHFDLKRTMELILTARAYQLPSVNLDEQRHKDFVFTGPAIRRLTSEQFRDALGSLTDVWNEKGDGEFDFAAGTGRARESMFAANLRPQWIWNDAKAFDSAPTGSVYFRRTIRLSERANEAFAVCTADNKFTLFVNGNKVGEGGDWERPRLLDLKPFLLKGENVIAIEAINDGEKPSPAGLLLYARVRQGGKAGGSERVMDFASDASWRWTSTKKDGWERPNFDDAAWQSAVVLGEGKLAKSDGRHLAARFSRILSGPTQYGKIRAALVKADPMTVALGRPNREQVITTRASAATTLQALELTNGSTLDILLKRGAEKLIANKIPNAPRLIDELYQRALGRAPTGDEMAAAREIIGEPANKTGVEDLLWAVAMLPEFQLIY